MSVKRKGEKEEENGHIGKKLKVSQLESKKKELGTNKEVEKSVKKYPGSEGKSKASKKDRMEQKPFHQKEKTKKHKNEKTFKDNTLKHVNSDATVDPKKTKTKQSTKQENSNTTDEGKKGMREKQKKLKAERQSKKKEVSVFDLGVQAKKVWNKVRGDDCPEEDRAKLINELHSLVKGNLDKIIRAHDTVRVVECLMAKGDETIRQAIYEELKEDLVSLSKSKYGTFFVQKLVKYGTKEQKLTVIRSFEGKVAELTRHKVANVVIEMAYNEFASGLQRIRLLQEFFGPEFRLCKEEELRSAVDIVTKHPQKERGIRRALAENCNILISKGCYNQSIVHTVLYNYMQLLNHIIHKKSLPDPEKKEEVPNEAGELAETPSVDFSSKARKARGELIVQLRDVCVHILHSHDGARLAMNALWHGSAKDRKAIIKSFKSFVPKICGEEFGHMVLLAAFDCVDDTKLIAKAVIGEMLGVEKDITTEKLTEIFASEKAGRKVLMYLLAGRDTTFFSPDYLALLKQGDGNEFTKKEDGIRRKELAATVENALFTFLNENLYGILKADTKSSIFIRMALNSPYASADKVKPVFERLADMASDTFVVGQENLVESSAGNLLLKKVILFDKTRHAIGSPTFSSILLNQIISKESIQCYLECNRGAFLLVAMIETGILDLKNLIAKHVKPLEKVLKSQSTKGAEILREKL